MITTFLLHNVYNNFCDVEWSGDPVHGKTHKDNNQKTLHGNWSYFSYCVLTDHLSKSAMAVVVISYLPEANNNSVFIFLSS